METFEKFLKPISDVRPCGEDIWFSEAKFQIVGPLEQAWRNEEEPKVEPKWSAIEDTASEMLERSRDLRVAIVWCLARLKDEGLAGFCAALGVIHGLIDKFWDDLHPLPENEADLVRINTLGNLSAPLGSDGPYQFVKYLRELPLLRSAAGSAYPLVDILRAENATPAGEEGATAHLTMAQVEAALAGMPTEERAKLGKLIGDTVGFADQIEKATAAKMGEGRGVNLDALKQVLSEMGRIVEPQAAPIAGVAGGQNDEAVAAAPGAGPSFRSGEIRSRLEADAALAAVADYFRRTEPSSPVPLLIIRARRLLNLGFMESMQDLAPDSVARFNDLFGLKESE